VDHDSAGWDIPACITTVCGSGTGRALAWWKTMVPASPASGVVPAPGTALDGTALDGTALDSTALAGTALAVTVSSCAVSSGRRSFAGADWRPGTLSVRGFAESCGDSSCRPGTWTVLGSSAQGDGVPVADRLMVAVSGSSSLSTGMAPVRDPQKPQNRSTSDRGFPQFPQIVLIINPLAGYRRPAQ
jgi:hypothetical protein